MPHRLLAPLAALCLLLLTSFPTAAQEDTSDEAWDVSAAHGPTKTVAFTTTEGTWMNLDVSPDGRHLVFDLLGDLYLLPIDGGKARRLTGGPAFDIQPRFSPDGRHISFTSDRGGADNVWIMQADGSDPQQVTKEDFRLLNNAVWTPDGEYLIARKHFTSTRSLGAGEMWLYHRSGGSGLQLTERKNDQQDAGEPAVSPDGRYVYFSEDMSGGSTFQYNKDANGRIYVIRRFDRETGELENFVSVQGGAVRPQPSPDGQKLAFVRRVRDESVLYVYDMESGAHRPLYDGLSRDQQEAWAIFGVYPNFDWTPDGEHIVLWADGHLRKVDVATREVTTIPFEAEVEQTLAEPVRFENEAHPERFAAKMIRDAATSPDGQTLVFHAAGYLYSKQLPDGEPKRLTRQHDRFEYDPAFSPDGRSIVYTTWSDADRGAVYRVGLDGSNPQKLTDRPGYYHTPRFSPDGSKLVFRRGDGNQLLGFLHGTEPGLYWMNASGGEMTFIQENGREPRFDHSGERVYFLSGGGLSKAYKSVRLDGGDERTHFDLTYVDQVVPSPDGRWVAFNELFNAYVAPMPKTGGAVTLTKDTKALPVKQITRDAGTELHWAGDSRSLHWMIGPEYFSRSLSESFAFVDGAPEELPPVDTTGLPVGLELEGDVPEGTLALVGARIVTMDGDEVIERGTVVVEGNRIAAVGAEGEVDVPSGAKVIDVSGKTIIPGLIDVHAHVNHFYSGPVPQQNWGYYANLAYGVTTTHDPSANTETVFTLNEMVRSGEIVGPRIFSTGRILYGADGDSKAVVNSLDDARSHLRRMKAVGAFSVKSYNQPRRNQRQQVLQAARELEMLVMPEGGSTFFHNVNQIVDGHTGIEHNLPIAPLYDDVVNVWRETNVGYTPTLVVSYGGLTGEYYWYEHTDVYEKERLLAFTPRPLVDARSRRRQKTPDEEYYHVDVAKALKRLTDEGVKVNMGAHGQLQGLGAHWELWMFAQGGMTPLEVLRAGTLNGAEYIGMQDDLGSIEAGKLADLVVLDANPLDDIRNTEHVRYTMANGRLFDAATMNEVGNHPKERQPFYWQREIVSDGFVWQGEAQGFTHPQCSCRH